MKKNIVFALLCAATIVGLSACNMNEQEFEPENGRVHSATFKVQLADDAETKTALMFKMVPDWRNTDLNDIHIFETETTSGGTYFMEASKVEMTTPVDGTYEKALFYAEFDNATVIVTPPETKAGNSSFSYTAILGQRVGDTYTLPAVQYPHEESNIDPKADFLVGRVVGNRTETLHEQTFDINFHRPVALSRMFITNLEGSKVLSIKITSLDDLTGSLKYEDIDFTVTEIAQIAQAADFKHNDNSNVLTLLYPGGRTRTSVFQPFLVTLAGAKRITEVEVRTDEYIYTKSYGPNGATINFKASEFNNITMDMTVKEGNNVTRTENNSQDIKFLLGGSEVTEDNGIVYDLNDHEGSVADFVSPILSGAVGNVTYSSSKTNIATVNGEGVVTLTGELGEVVISAYAAGSAQVSPGSASYKITVKDSTPVPQSLSFNPTTLTVTLGDDFTEPVLSGVKTTVSYSSSNEDVATVDADGELTLVAAGEATITAVAVAGEADGVNYTEGTASYVLTVNNPSSDFVTVELEPATELVAGEKYVLVSNGFALVRDGEDASAAAFDATALTVAVPTALQGNLEWTLEQKSGSITRGNEYVFTQGTYFFGIAMNTNQTTYTYTVEVNNGRNVATNISIQDHNISLADDLMYYAGNSSNYYVFYNTADSIWDNEKVSNSANPAATSTTALYKLKDLRAEQNLQFSAAAAEYDLYTSSWTVAVPTLQNPQGTVTYDSGNTAVATVNNSGEVTIASTAKKGDTAVITANAAGNNTYKPGSASYTISIVNSNPNVTRYNKVTSTSDLEVGAKYLLVFEGLAGDADDGDPKVYDPVLNNDGTQFAKATSSALDVTIANSTIESSDFDDCQFTLEAGYYLKADNANKYIYPGSSGSSSVMLAEASASHALTIAFSDGIAEIKNGSRYLVWSTSNHYFSCNTSVSGQYSTGICLYKLDDGRTAQPAQFSAATAEYDVYTSSWTVAVPTLQNPQGTVTYESGNTAVATVNNSGEVTIASTAKKGDTAVITANVGGNSSYKPGSASYTISIVDSNPSVTLFTKVTSADEIVEGGTYAILYQSGETNKAFKFVLNSAKTQFSTGTDNAVDVTVSGNTVNADELEGCQFILDAQDGTSLKFAMLVPKADGTNDYYFRVRGSSRTNFQAHASDSGYRSTFAISSDGVLTIVRTESNTSYNFSYSSSNGYFQAGTSSSSNLYLYKLDNGSTQPEPPTPETPTYSFITPSDFVSGATYLIVSADSGNYNKSDKQKAFDGTTSGGVVTVADNGGTITGDFSACEFVITASGSNYTLKIGSNYVTGNQNSGSRYIQVSTTSGTMSLASATELSSADSGDGKVADAFYFYYTKGSGSSASKEVLYLNSDGNYKIGGSGRKYGVYLYKKN